MPSTESTEPAGGETSTPLPSPTTDLIDTNDTAMPNDTKETAE